LACVREDAVLGRECIIGRGACIENGVILADRAKVQTNTLLFKPAKIGDDVFTGPAVILTNDRYPRSSTVDGQLKRDDDWTAEGVIIEEVRDVPDFAIVVGGPARRIGWAGMAGVPPEKRADDAWICPATGVVYAELNSVLQPEWALGYSCRCADRW
jgi:acetyltransferase-like isoleucine patch superfamily enzyme